MTNFRTFLKIAALSLSIAAGTTQMTKAQPTFQPSTIEVKPGTKVTEKVRKSVILVLYDDLRISPSRYVPYNTGFSISTDVINYGDETFNGDLVMCVLSGSTITHTIAGFKVNMPPNNHFSPNLVFSTTGMSDLTIGTYEAALLYTPDQGQTWYRVSGTTSYPYYSNSLTFDITCPGNMSAESASIDTVIVQGSSLNLSLWWRNNTTCPLDAITYCYIDEGTYPYNRIYSDTNSIHFEPNDLKQGVFVIKDVDFSIGDNHQLVIVMSIPENALLTWGRYISVILEEDKYEPNNTMETSAELPVNFSGNTAIVTSDGSNIHASNDIDYYKVWLSGGYDYTIMARVHDSKNSGNSQTYTCDVEFDVNTIGTFWSQKYDLQADPIADFKGGAVTFRVTPKSGQKGGTYLLEVAITRKPNGEDAINEFSENNNEVKIYPNPTNNQLTIENGELTIESVEIYNIVGQKLQSKIVNLQSKIEIDVSHLANGMYFLKVDGKTIKFVKN